MLCVGAFITIMVIILIKMKKQAHIIELATQRRRTTVPRYDEVDCQALRGIRASNYTYDEVDCQPQKETTTSTNKNIAYFNSNKLGQADANKRVYAKVE